MCASPSAIPATGLAEVVVADDGVGLPEAPDSPTAEGRLGLHLVPRLAKQAQCALSLELGRRHAGDLELRVGVTRQGDCAGAGPG